jgi:hypothetical protein
MALRPRLLTVQVIPPGVRKYLLNHFQLNSGNLGAVALMNLPPSGFGHSTWDGICIVVLQPKR